MNIIFFVSSGVGTVSQFGICFPREGPHLRNFGSKRFSTDQVEQIQALLAVQFDLANFRARYFFVVTLYRIKSE